MKTTACSPANRRSAKGMALVLTLCALVLITVLLVAFFSKAQITRQIAFSSTNIGKADSMARTAANLIVGELRQEIVESSNVLQGDPAAPNEAYPPIYSVKPGFSPSPTKIGVETPNEIGETTIAKVSADGLGMRPSSTVLASSVGIDQASVNGRKLSIEKWFGEGGPSLGSQAALPTWVYMTRSGQQAVPSDPSEVLGRYAYTVYDVSGRLDANVAGYPLSTDVGMIDEVGGKISTAYADLSAIDATVFTPAVIDHFVQWRNGDAATSVANYKDFVAGDAAADGNLHATNAATSTPAKKYTQQRFFSRRDLLRSVEDGILPDKAELFTHFSRSKVRPVWTPEKDAAEMGGNTTTHAYRSNAEKVKDSDGNFVANRNVGNVRYSGPATITKYRDDGTSYTEDVVAGDPLVPQRFSLAKLAWIGHDGPNATAFDSALSPALQAKAIEDNFGLKWKSGDKRWNYEHGNSERILTLEEVRMLNRPPDFVELLKAGILSGSLGQDPGAKCLDINADDTKLSKAAYKAAIEGPIGAHFDEFSKDSDRHLMQIAANIIDQADANNFPTALYFRQSKFDSFAVSNSEAEFNATFFGLENLPMLQRMGVIVMVEPSTDPAKSWLQPDVWNMNDPSTAGTGLNDPKYPTPSALRLVTFGSSVLLNVTDMLLGEPVDFGMDFKNPSIKGTICFKNPGPNSTSPVSFFGKPINLKGFEKAKADRKYEDSTCPSGPDNRYPLNSTKVTNSNNNNQFMAVYLGNVVMDITKKHNIHPNPAPTLSFVLQYYDGTDWRSYSALTRLEQLHPSIRSSSGTTGDSSCISGNGHVDPRTQRFSGAAGRIASGNIERWVMGSSVRPVASTVTAKNADGRSPVYQAFPRTTSGFTHTPDKDKYYYFDDWANNLPTSEFRYKDRDGIVRPGDGWRGDSTTGDGMLMYHSDTFPLSSARRRSVILNRPFKSVGELGYVYRDLPFKTLDLWSETSADAGLLALFSATEAAEVQAGLINPNAASPEVLAALLKGASKQGGSTPPKIVEAEATALAKTIKASIESADALPGPASLVTKLSDPIHVSFAGVSDTATDKPAGNKTHGEAPIRALSGCVDTQTWNLLIDVVAQTGRIAPQRTNLRDFVVEGECRYWVHVALDRTTGEIVSTQFEPAAEQ